MTSQSTVRFTTIVLVLAGFAAVFLAWNGAAGQDHVPAQLPYLISGGLTGVILVGVGLVLLRNFESRRDSRRVEARLDALREAIDRLAAEQQTQRAAASGSSWGAGASPGAPRSASAAQPGETLPLSASEHRPVVAGPTTYHREDCHLVANRHAPRTSRAAAWQRNLTPCRVCNPDDPTSGEPADGADEADGDAGESLPEAGSDTQAGWEPVR